MRALRTFFFLVMLAVIGAIWRWQALPPEPISAGIDLGAALSDDSGDFAKVIPGHRLSLPSDHGEHPDFKTEWWYFTGNLQDSSGHPYGYQLTIFRSGLARPQGALADSAWTPKDVMMGHFAVSDLDRGQFYPYQRFARRSLGLSGVRWDGALSVWLEDWRMERAADGRWTLRASETLPGGEPLQLELRLSEAKPPVLQGQDGYSRKGPAPEHASYYVSITRMPSEGTLTLGDRVLDVRGLSWFDHEWSSSALAPGLVGWDWFSLQLEDGWEIMLYLLRYQDGRTESASSGALIAPDGSKVPLALSDFEVKVESRHRSARGVEYPSGWTIRLPGHSMLLRVRPRLLDQEMAGEISYWEGAVTVQAERAGQMVEGSGFVEMTGYASDL